MDSENYIKIKTNIYSLKDEKSTDALETPQIRNFRHENESNNIFSNSFKQENQKNNAEELPRLNSIPSADSPLNNEFSAIIDPSEPYPVSSFTINSSDSSKSAPKKKFLERTISQTDEQQKQDRLMQDLNQNFMRQDSQQKTEDKCFKRSLSNRNFEIIEEISKNAKTVHQPINDICSQNKRHINRPQNEKKTTIETLLKNDYPPSNKISSLIMQKEAIKTSQSMDIIEIQTEAKKSKQKDDIVTSSEQDTEKKQKSKRSIMMNSDLRKQQIRNSNREAARRCRERRSNYIKQLENKITALETKQKTLLNDNGALIKQVHELKKIIMDNNSCNLGYNSHSNFNHLNNNFGANQQIKSVPVVLTLEIPNNGSLNNMNNNSSNNIRQITNVLNGNNSLINNPDMLKHMVDALHYRPSSQQQLIDSQSHPQSTKINK